MADYWQRETHADRRPQLLARNRIKRALQGWFDAQGFTAVECGAVQRSPGNETHLHAFACQWRPEGGVAETRYLHTSPEFAAKKLLAAGETQIVDFARVWRNREAGPLHAPEFTMIEWYRADADWTQVMDDAVALCRTALAASGNAALAWQGRNCSPGADPDAAAASAAGRVSAAESSSSSARSATSFCLNIWKDSGDRATVTPEMSRSSRSTSSIDAAARSIIWR